jgi:hypothetical protein
MPTQTYRVQDALLTKQAVIANGAVTAPLDLGELTGNGARLEEYELRISAEASTSAALPANTSVVYTLEFSAADSMTDPVSFTCSAWKQTGSANGADEAEFRFRLPTNLAERYVRVKAAVTGTPGTITAKFGLELLG